MNRFSILGVLHLLFLVVIIGFIYFFYTVYQPLKAHDTCAKSSAERVLGLNSQLDTYTLYQEMYKKCISQKGNLLTLLSF